MTREQDKYGETCFGVYEVEKVREQSKRSIVDIEEDAAKINNFHLELKLKNNFHMDQ